MANRDKGATLGIDVQGNVRAANPAAIRTASRLISTVSQRTSIHGPVDPSRRIRRSRNTTQLHRVSDLSLSSSTQENILGCVYIKDMVTTGNWEA